MISNLQFAEVSQLLKQAKNFFEDEYILLDFSVDEADSKVYVIGDIHGNLHSLLNLIEIIEKNDPELIIFLGDIVDRGVHQLECLIIILSLKILYPNKIYILKGNHETLEMNQYYGFFHVFLDRFKDSQKFQEVLEIYNVLPFCAIINKKILCVHGGIPENSSILEKIKGIKTKNLNSIIESIEQDLYQSIWNDPKEGLEEFMHSFRGPGIKFFGEKAFNDFMEANHLQYLIRAHECFLEGYKWFFKERLLSIFSSANYRGLFSPNPASYAIIEGNQVFPQLISSRNNTNFSKSF